MELNLDKIEDGDKELSKGTYPNLSENMITITLHLPKQWKIAIDRMVEDGHFANRSEGIRHMIRVYFDTFEVRYMPYK